MTDEVPEKIAQVNIASTAAQDRRRPEGGDSPSLGPSPSTSNRERQETITM